jgi:hypothetical protein
MNKKRKINKSHSQSQATGASGKCSFIIIVTVIIVFSASVVQAGILLYFRK